MPAPSSRSIGQVLKVLKEDFEDISISKIRFLEGEGLVSPERAPSGYRRYSDQDIARLRYILEVQQKHYLPLKVIREHLEKLDAGEQPVSGTTSEPPPLEPVVTPTPPERQPQAKRPINIPRRELLRLSGLSENQLIELERHALVVPRRGTVQYGRDALTIAVAARKLAAYGMDARHLRAIKQAAEREASLIDQSLLTPHVRHRSGSRQAVADVMQLVLYAHAALLRSSITS
ncbi:MAG TPA: MerR family transcriptional regulator [Propioniciclava sp.]|jgi:DNA-binding transcriptional MerR regulator|uniref:transcriptional regulator FtsR n=1 Tax=Propioniciclava sp. TaxID=2038686 RepID=UPI002CBCEC22|nr:MerR family transcriptional regulator [Propioniciclava sp.]HRL79802.1 MerR family transcriptional regulator [Propioniciclava sp.]